MLLCRASILSAHASFGKCYNLEDNRLWCSFRISFKWINWSHWRPAKCRALLPFGEKGNFEINKWTGTNILFSDVYYEFEECFMKIWEAHLFFVRNLVLEHWKLLNSGGLICNCSVQITPGVLYAGLFNGVGAMRTQSKMVIYTLQIFAYFVCLVFYCWIFFTQC